MALAAATTVALTLPLTGVALADQKPGPDGSPVPSQAQVNRAEAEVTAKRQSVAQLESALADATARMETASLAASVAAEDYNGAMWRLEQAHSTSTRAQEQARLAGESVERQRSGIVTLVTDSYQNGAELNAATAMLGDEGPKELMNRYAVVVSAGDSMEARYDAFRAASAEAKAYAAKAAKAQRYQRALAAEAKGLAVAAGQAASAAGAAANQISTQKQTLLQAVAEAENISLGLATRRHEALERIAKQKVAAARQAQEAAEAAKLRNAAKEARKKASDAKPTRATGDAGGASAGGSIGGPVGSPAPPPVANPAPNQAVAVRRAIAYAEQQLGKPYEWAAVGPGSFDCSGLTMNAWAQGGVALPHYSVAQFAQSTRVSMADARPGDLLFWTNNGSPSGIHHVALYLGGGQFIEAARTGTPLRYNSIYTWYPDFVARP